MKFLLTVAAAAATAFVAPGSAQVTGQGAPVLQAGSSPQNSPTVSGAVVPEGRTMNRNIQAQMGASAPNESASSAATSSGTSASSMPAGSSTDSGKKKSGASDADGTSGAINGGATINSQ